MKTVLIAVSTGVMLAAAPFPGGTQGISTAFAQTSPIIGSTPSSPVVNTPRGAEVGVGGTRSYEQLSGPGGGGIMTPNSNGTSTITPPNGVPQTVPTPR